MIQSEEFSVTNVRSGLRESSVMKLGDKVEGRLAYIEQFEKDERVLARKEVQSCDVRCIYLLQDRPCN